MTLVAFLLLVVIAGGNPVAIRFISCDSCELDPFWAAGSRFTLAAVIFSVLAVVRRVAMPRGRALLGAVLYGALTFGGAFGFGYWGFVRVQAGLGAVLLATAPLFTFMLALAHRQERFRWEGLVGAALALVGTAVVFWDGIDTGAPFIRMLALVAGAACFAEGAIVVKRFPPVHSAAMNAIGMAAGAAILLALGAVFNEAYVVPEAATTWRAQAYLVILGSVGVFALDLFVLHRWTASATSYGGVVVPLVTILLSAALLDERITRQFAAGSMVVVIAVYFGALRRAAEL